MTLIIQIIVIKSREIPITSTNSPSVRVDRILVSCNNALRQYLVKSYKESCFKS